MTFRNATVTCGSCSAVAYYQREIGVSARQITLLAGSTCKRCGHKVAEVVVSSAPPPSGEIVVELPDDEKVI